MSNVGINSSGVVSTSALHAVGTSADKNMSIRSQADRKSYNGSDLNFEQLRDQKKSNSILK